MKVIIYALIAATVLMTSCATIFTGTTDTIRFESDPEGAAVYIDGEEVCKTPCSSEVKRSGKSKMFEMKLDGYKARVITLDQKFNLISLVNLLNWVGFIVDLATGSIKEYDKKIYHIELEQKVSLNNPTRIDINTINKTVDIYVTQK